MDADEILASESRRRLRAGVAAVGASVLTLVGFVLLAGVYSDQPEAGVLDALGSAAAPGAVASAESQRVAFFDYRADQATGFVLASVIAGAGLILMGVALRFLAVSTRARAEVFPRLVMPLPIIGGVLFALTLVLGAIGLLLDANVFLDGPRTVESVGDSLGTVTIAAGFIGIPARFAAGVALVLIALNAMKVGLLTRFMGVLGILCGALFVIPLGSDVPVVQSFWFGALAVLFLRPGSGPPAWRTGRAEPWPTQQQLREERDRLRAERQGRGRPPREAERTPEQEPVGAGVGSRGAPHPSSNKRKRKRRT